MVQCTLCWRRQDRMVQCTLYWRRQEGMVQCTLYWRRQERKHWSTFPLYLEDSNSSHHGCHLDTSRSFHSVRNLPKQKRLLDRSHGVNRGSPEALKKQNGNVIRRKVLSHSYLCHFEPEQPLAIPYQVLTEGASEELGLGQCLRCYLLRDWELLLFLVSSCVPKLGLTHHSF